LRRYARRWAKEHGAATAAVYSHEVVLLSGVTVTVKVAHVALPLG
jgi:hypothetical protein